MSSGASQSALKSAAVVSTVFMAFTAYLVCLVQFYPFGGAATNYTRTELRFPRNLDEARSIADLLNEYKSNHFFYVLVLFCSAYIYKQLFCVPGSVFLNLVGGALFGVPIGVPLCCLLNATGASCCYLLVAACRDSMVRIAYVRKRLASLVNELNAQLGERAFEVEEQDSNNTTIADHTDPHSTAKASQLLPKADAQLQSTGLRERVRTVPTSSSTDSSEQQTNTQSTSGSGSGSTQRLLFVLIGLRLIPLCPQWLINLASPIIGVPLRVFFLSALIGLLPYNFICVQTGSVLRELRSLDSLFNPQTLVQLILVAAACLFAPSAFRRLRARFTSTHAPAA